MKIDPTYLAELSSLSFRIKRKIFSKYSGDELTKQTGDGLTFKDYSQYAMGDDVRRIDWKIYARTGELYVKRYQADRNLTMHVLLDASGSMDYGDEKTHKCTYAAKLALAVAYVLGQHQGRVRFGTFSEHLHQARTVSGTATLNGMIRTLEQTNIHGKTNIVPSLQAYKLRHMRSKSKVVVFSDFLVPEPQLEQLFKILGASQATLVHIGHPDELDLRYKGDFKLSDAETGNSLHVHVSPRMASKYQKQLQTHVNAIKHLAHKSGMTFVEIDTGKPFIESFMKVWESI